MSREIILLGKRVVGTEVEGSPSKIRWQVKLGPYEAILTEWTFGYRESDHKTVNYSYSVKVGSEYIINNESSVENIEDALLFIIVTINNYIKDKKSVEEYIDIVVANY